MDLIIKNGWIVNGKKEKPFTGDLAIKNGIIEEIGACIQVPENFPKECILDAAGGYVTPGFIDIHRHGDWKAFGNGDDELLNRQGLTSVVNGNCGLSVAPAGTEHGKEIAGFLSSVTGDFPSDLPAKPDWTSVMESMESYMSALKKEKRSVQHRNVGRKWHHPSLCKRLCTGKTDSFRGKKGMEHTGKLFESRCPWGESWNCLCTGI